MLLIGMLINIAVAHFKSFSFFEGDYQKRQCEWWCINFEMETFIYTKVLSALQLTCCSDSKNKRKKKEGWLNVVH